MSKFLLAPEMVPELVMLGHLVTELKIYPVLIAADRYCPEAEQHMLYQFEEEADD